ncbi:MAG: hypothetical protein J5858_13430, partial [Lentisphaeria bacterium]|nr:hypothetical protein [Lentisphaeria bacterium]
VRTDNLDFLKKSSGILHQALIKAGNDPVLKMRVLHELNNVDFCLIRVLKLQGRTRKELAPMIAAYQKNLVYALEQNALLNRTAKDKILQDIQAEIDMLAIDFDLPKELKKRPLRAVRKLGLSYFRRVRSSGAELVSDPLSEMRTCVTINNLENARHKLPFALGYYDWNHKKGGVFKLKEVKADNRYHWYKLGRLVVGPNSVLWCHGSWGMMTDLRNVFIPNDGLIGTDADPNVYECWVSLRFNGPAYTGKKALRNANKESGVWLDKVLLVSYAKP